MLCNHCEDEECPHTDGCTCDDWGHEIRYVTRVTTPTPFFLVDSEETAQQMADALNAGEEIPGISDAPVFMDTQPIAVSACICCEKIREWEEDDIFFLAEVLGEYLAGDDDTPELIE